MVRERNRQTLGVFRMIEFGYGMCYWCDKDDNIEIWEEDNGLFYQICDKCKKIENLSGGL